MKKPLFNQIAIVGLGLIGGTLALATKKMGLARQVIGVSRSERTLLEALRRKAVDVATTDLKKGVSGADLVVLCAPVSVIESQLKVIQKYLKKNALVTDVGSSKIEIERAARTHLKKNTFVGAHPLAGSEKTGIFSADADLFKRSVCFITKRNTRVEGFWKALGSRPVILNAVAHDDLVAKTSHTPHALAFSLFQTKKDFPRNTPPNPSIRELARLAKSDADLWADVFMSNREALLESIVETERKGIHLLKEMLRLGDRAGIVRFIKQANKNSFNS